MFCGHCHDSLLTHLQGEFDSGYLYKCKFTSPEEKTKIRPDAADEPVLAVPIVESDDIPISTLIFRYVRVGIIFKNHLD